MESTDAAARTATAAPAPTASRRAERSERRTVRVTSAVLSMNWI